MPRSPRSAGPRACCSASTASAAPPPRSMRTGWCAGPARYGRGAAMVEALFSAHFTDGRDIGDRACAGRRRRRLRPGRRRGAALPAWPTRRSTRARREPARAPARHQRRAVLRHRRAPRDRRRAGAGGDRAAARRGAGGGARTPERHARRRARRHPQRLRPQPGRQHHRACRRWRRRVQLGALPGRAGAVPPARPAAAVPAPTRRRPISARCATLPWDARDARAGPSRTPSAFAA